MDTEGSGSERGCKAEEASPMVPKEALRKAVFDFVELVVELATEGPWRGVEVDEGVYATENVKGQQ